MELCHRLCDATHGAPQVLPHLRVLGPDRAGELRLAGDDVVCGSGLEPTHRDDRGVRRVDLPRDDRLDGHDDEAADDDRVDRLVGPGGVRFPPGDADVEGLGGRVHDAVGDHQRSGGEVSVHVPAEDGPHAVEDSGSDHRLRSRADLLGRLKDEPHGGRQIVAPALEKLRRPEQHAHVRVVAAGVHHAFVARREGKSGLLVDGQSVEIGPQGHGGNAVRSLDVCDDSRVEHSAVRDGQLVQQLADTAGSPDLGPAQLRVSVQVAADLDHPLVQDWPHGTDHGRHLLMSRDSVAARRQARTPGPPGPSRD